MISPQAGEPVASHSRSILRPALRLVPGAFLGLFFAYPLATIAARGLSASAFDAELGRIALITAGQALASTVLTMAVGLPAAYVLARRRVPARRLIGAALTAPFVLPAVVVGAAYLALLPAQAAETWWAIIAAHATFNVAVVTRTVGALWGRLDPRLGEAARVLGASPARVARELTLPLLAPALAAAGSLVFLFSFTSFGVVQLLGGPTRVTVESEIYRATTQDLALDRASTIALAQLAGMAVVLALASWFARRRGVALRRGAPIERRPIGLAAAIALLGPALVFCVLPLAMLAREAGGLGAYSSLTRTEAGFLEAPLASVVRSLEVAAVAGAIALVVGACAAYAVRGGVLETALMLPLGTSAVTVGFGFLIAFDERPIDWRSAWLAVPLAQAVVGIPFVVRSVLPVLRSIDPRLREAAAVLGASPGRVWREIDLPLSRRALAVGLGFAFAVSLGEFGAASFLARPDAPTVPVAIARLLGRPGELAHRQAFALATILAGLVLLVMLALELVRDPEVAEL